MKSSIDVPDESTVPESGYLSWQREDFEQRLGFRGGKYTDVNNWLTLIIALLMVGIFYLIIIFGVRESILAQMFLDRVSRLIPFWIAFLSAWSAAMLLVKWRKLTLQRRALILDIIPRDNDFVLAATTAPKVLQDMYQLVDNPKHFVLLCRIERALANLKNIGRVSDVIEMLESQAQNDEDHMESSYTILRGFIWGIPVLGFIGTVLGLSSAIGGFGEVLAKTSNVGALAEHLKGVTGGLSTAFETTLQGLVAALCIQLVLAIIRKGEEKFLGDCKEYCHKHLISKLRLINVTSDAEMNSTIQEDA